MKILVIDDDYDIGTFFRYLLVEQGHHIDLAHDGKEYERLRSQNHLYELAFIDLKLPDTNGLRLLADLKQAQPSCRCIVMTGYSTIDTAVEAVKLGAEDYIEKPFEDISIIEEKIKQPQSEPGVSGQIEQAAARSGLIIGESEAMKEVVRLAGRFAPKPLTILIDGETGTGKEVAARFIHELAGPGERLFLGVNCGALPEQMLESELFGHEAGAFTGANKTRKGYFELASGGTLLLDEIGEASLSTQVKLLRVLETRELYRVGGERPIKTKARIIAATNQDLHLAAEAGEFREDLLYRLEVVRLTIPPLRERKEDIPAVAQSILRKEAPANTVISLEALDALQAHHWPGNIRELTNVLVRAAAESDGRIERRHLNMRPSSRKTAARARIVSGDWLRQKKQELEETKYLSLESTVEDIRSEEKKSIQDIIDHALMLTRGNRREAAEMLGVNTRKLRYWLNE
ncbi:sigma-54-dependent transcriptional regulator [Marinococcus luteus]|uniref:sigma-54-dependent transcriptional regulator n=1 Tax=Marinococcus luteus TaxID=1122204 RepID=UPI002ACCBB34|nr:sigma-54 dependent transcriptional regulator [Marinococcus luteus]MDZ5782603.1 sigma-54 dependent transcriptional regulator [Marinococcus luteus]